MKTTLAKRIFVIVPLTLLLVTVASLLSPVVAIDYCSLKQEEIVKILLPPRGNTWMRVRELVDQKEIAELEAVVHAQEWVQVDETRKWVRIEIDLDFGASPPSPAYVFAGKGEVVIYIPKPKIPGRETPLFLANYGDYRVAPDNYFNDDWKRKKGVWSVICDRSCQ